MGLIINQITLKKKDTKTYKIIVWSKLWSWIITTNTQPIITNWFYAKDKMKELRKKRKKNNIKSVFLNHEDLRLMTTKHACICKNHQSIKMTQKSKTQGNIQRKNVQPINVSKPKNLTVKSKPRKMQ
jgi:aspartate oxidase